MSEALAHSPEERRPTASRTKSELLRARPKTNRSTSIDKPTGETSLDESLHANTTLGSATSGPSQEPKAKKKPRKLVIRNAQSTTPRAPSHDPSESKSFVEEAKEMKETSLDARVSTLESEYRKLRRRTNSNTVEISKLQNSTRITPAASSSSTSTDRLEKLPEDNGMNRPEADTIDRLDNKPKDTHPVELDRVEELPDEEIETISRSAAPAIGNPTEQNQSVALKGSYKIPLPATLSTDDVRAVQNGLAAASTVAREIATAMRGGRSRNDSVFNETGQGKAETEPTVSTSIAHSDSQVDVSSPRSWTSLLNTCTKLVSNAANAIEMGAAVEATRKDSLRGEIAKQQNMNERAGQRAITTSKTRNSTRPNPAVRTYSDISRLERLSPTTPLPKPSTRRSSSATAPTQSSAGKISTRAAAPMLATQVRTRNASKDPKNVAK